jgi:hypothetical protein
LSSPILFPLQPRWLGRCETPMCTSASMCSAQHRWVVVVVSGGMKRPYPTTSLGSRMTTPHRFVALRWTAHQTSCYPRWFPVCLARRRNGQAGRAGGAMRCGVVCSAARARDDGEKAHSLITQSLRMYLSAIDCHWVGLRSFRPSTAAGFSIEGHQRRHGEN